MFLADVCIEQEGGVGMEAEWNVVLLQPPQYLANSRLVRTTLVAKLLEMQISNSVPWAEAIFIKAGKRCSWMPWPKRLGRSVSRM